MARTKSLFEQGYRVGALHEGEGFVRVYRGKREGESLEAAASAPSSYHVSVLDMTCECKGFRRWRSCSHLIQIADMIAGTVREMDAQIKANEAKIKSGWCTFREVAKMERDGDVTRDEITELNKVLRLISTETVLEVLA